MKKYYFLNNYKSSTSLFKTMKFIDMFVSELQNKIINKYNLLIIHLPIIQNYNSNSDYRLINFDNMTNNKIYQILSDANLFQLKIMHKLKLEDNFNGIFSFYTKFKRDSIVDSTNSINESIFDICIKIAAVDKIDINNFMTSYISSFYKLVIDTYESIKDKINLDLTFSSDSVLKLLSIDNYLKKFNTLKINDYLVHAVSNNQLVLVTHSAKVESKYLSNLNLITDDINNSCELLYWYEQINSIVSLMRLNLSSSSELLESQNKSNNEYMKYLDLINDTPQYLHIVINVSKILMILLNKIHIGEVTPSAWDDDLIYEANDKKIDIL